MVIYISNFLEKEGLSPGAALVLTSELSKYTYVVKCSSIKNPFLRFLEMLFITVVYGPRSKCILIDLFSTSAFWFAVVVGGLSRLISKKYMVVLRGGDLPKRYKSDPIVSKKLLDSAYSVVAPSQYLKDATEMILNIPTVVIPNPLVVSNYNFLPSRPALPLKMLWVRSLHQKYNPQMAVEVLLELNNRGCDAYLCMVGPDKDGSQNLLDDLIIEKGLLARVKMTGYLPKKDWISLSKDYNIFINTTNVDNTPVSVLEAMALGLPVITTKAGGLPYMIDHGRNGFLVDSDDSKAMADTIEYLIKNEDARLRVVHCARERVEQYDIKKVALEILKLV